MLEILNVLMRFFTWEFALYRWIKKREEFMLFLSLALWMDFLAALAQAPVLKKLGVTPEATSLLPLLAMLAVAHGILLLATSLYLLGQLKNLHGQLLLVGTVIGGSAYVLLATIYSLSSVALMAFPVPFMGTSLMVLGYALIKKEVGVKNIATLFPIGAFLLGAINLAYPVTMTTSFGAYLYGAGAAFRAMMFIGMMRYALFQVTPPRAPVVDIPQGAFYVDDQEYLQIILQTMESAGNGVLITRNPPEHEPPIPVFWVTRVASNSPLENMITVLPTDMGILIDLVKRHLEKGHSIVVLDCFEYLALENSFESAFKFLLSLKDHIINFGGTLIVATDPSTYPEKQWKLMTREFERLEFKRMTRSQ